MEKQFIDAVDLLKIAAQHAYCAEHLLKQNGEILIDEQLSIDALLPITSLMYQAFELTLKAFLVNDHRQVMQYKTLHELLEFNNDIGLSSQDIQLITTLARQQAFRKGVDYALWENRQQLHVFCEEIVSLYEAVQKLMPVELQSDYQAQNRSR
jgi:HEPN domain-containing protein